MAQHGDFNGEVRVTATDEADQVKHAAERPEEKQEDHSPDARRGGPIRQSPVHRRWMTFSAHKFLDPTGRGRKGPQRVSVIERVVAGQAGGREFLDLQGRVSAERRCPGLWFAPTSRLWDRKGW